MSDGRHAQSSSQAVIAGDRKRQRSDSDSDEDEQFFADILELFPDVLEQIQSEGEGGSGPDLLLSGGEDILSVILPFLTVDEVCRCEMTCKTLKRIAQYYWADTDKDLDSSCKTASARGPRGRVVRYHRASTFARGIGGLGESIARHVVTDKEGRQRRRDDHCRQCSVFPQVLDFNALLKDTRNDNELFIRLSRTSDNALFVEGFFDCGYSDNGNENTTVYLQDSHLSKWPKMQEVMRLYRKQGRFRDTSLLEECMRELTATVVAVNKFSSEPSIVAVQSDFADAIDKEEPEEVTYCWTPGQLKSRTHGDLDPLADSVYLGMIHLGDMDEGGCWTLECTVEHYTRYYPGWD